MLVLGAAQARIVDLGQGATAPNPTWQNTNPRQPPSPERNNANAVLLPDGTLIVVGGSRNDNITEDGVSPVLAAERYDPASGQWSTLAEACVPRGYHSVALLLPDGRVWTAGSDKNGNRGQAARELRIELFEPWYYSTDRPQITYAPNAVTYCQHFTVCTTQACAITRVALIRTGSVTHAFNADQRYVGLRFCRARRDRVEVEAPPNSALAVPGYYLLFVINGDNIPSVGKFIKVGPTCVSGNMCVGKRG
ncbi:MAG: DUF1929 domain-containing protein [Deltaproteobacteria bacterium]|nr:DUF1929 domain-containing protein [Deltaproteobacteria bacterium]